MTATSTFQPPTGLEGVSLRLIPHVLRPLPPLAQEMFETFMLAFGGRAVHLNGYTYLGGGSGGACRRAGAFALPGRPRRLGAARAAPRPRDLRGVVVGGLRALAAAGARAGAAGVFRGGGPRLRLHDAAPHGRGRTGERADGLLRGEAGGAGGSGSAGGVAAPGG